ncbi:hypothetical protein [Aliikangiella maris]|uniref:Uncharacterized protein n=2 Tax=Aliikangiella maris TaxID=3162458 RepID=A0ABV2BWC8_9GAMM
MATIKANLLAIRFLLLISAGALLLNGCYTPHSKETLPNEIKSLQTTKNTAVQLTQMQSSKTLNPQHYQQVINFLLTSDAVVPPRPNVHPVSTVFNREAIIPPMCYTKTEGQYNPCYVCHQNNIQPHENVMNDGDLQQAYSFSDVGMTNHWQNLFQNRASKIQQISDQDIIQWVNQDNYSELAPRLKAAGFKGYIPDIKNLQEGKAAFDSEGFAKDGSHWVAFNYKPFPSTFWPTNGSTDDVMIKLPKPYRTNVNGEYSRDIYKANLAIVEAKIKNLSTISLWPIDENLIQKDLNQDNRLTLINEITDVSSFVGAAKDYYIESFVYPQGTEFLHTVRYLGINQQGEVGVSRRMKEVRYMKKWKAYPKGTLARYYEEEAFEKEAGHLPGYTDVGDHGLDNGMGWAVQGFIENKNGRLRAASFEENLFCMGCHNSIGSTIDKTFSFARKVDGQAGWQYINLKGMADVPNKGEHQGEILTYLERTGGGDEFRSNDEMLANWFTQDGKVDYAKVAGKDVYQLITPSISRALMLNKAYRVIVDEQRFLFGRDATVLAPQNVYQKIDNATAPTLKPEATYSWDIRLDWNKH